MPFHLNQVNLAGTMTRDAEIKYTPKGTAVADFAIAINRVWKNDAGEKMEDTVFVDIKAWGRTAEVIGEHTAKGHTIFIEGRLCTDSWDDKETQKKRVKMYVTCEKFYFVSRPKEDDGGSHSYGRKEERQDRHPQTQRAPITRPYQQQPKQPIDPDLDAADGDDIPF